VLQQVEVRCYPEVGLEKMDGGWNYGDGIGDKMHHLDPVEVEEAAEEVARRDPEPALDMREEDDGLAGPLSGELLTHRRPST
jgi:hypothetical protein